MWRENDNLLLKGEDHRHAFFFNDTATTEIYTLSLHDALPICFATELVPKVCLEESRERVPGWWRQRDFVVKVGGPDRESTRLNSSHRCISYAVFCLKKIN